MVKVKAIVCGQSHEFFFLKIRDLRITYRYFGVPYTNFETYILKSERFVELEIKASPTKNFSTEAQGWSKCSEICSIN